MDEPSDDDDGPEFEPVRLQHRSKGWTPERQSDFLTALSECACVDEACKRVGMSVSSAYALRRRIDAKSFRLAWEAALDFAIRRLSDAAFSRALNGVVRPIFFQGEQVGERRHYDERLTMFLLRYRDPVRYGAWVDGCTVTQPEDADATLAQLALARAEKDALDRNDGREARNHGPLPEGRKQVESRFADEPEEPGVATDEEMEKALVGRLIDMADRKARGEFEGDVS